MVLNGLQKGLVGFCMWKKGLGMGLVGFWGFEGPGDLVKCMMNKATKPPHT